MRNKNVYFCLLIILALTVVGGCGGEGGGGGGGGTTTSAREAELKEIQDMIEKAGYDWVAGRNPIFDLTDEERRNIMGNEQPELPDGPLPRLAYRPAAQTVPASFDWRSNNGNWVTPVKNQGQCGSCVAHAIAAVAESMFRISANDPNLSIDLSESYAFSCAGRVCGSGGWYTYHPNGSPLSSPDWMKVQGAVDEACLPYQAVDGMCAQKCADWSVRLKKISAYSLVSPVWSGTAWVAAPAAQIKAAVLQGPLMTSISVYSDFYSYTSGIYKKVSTSYQGGHAVTIVGYNDNVGSAQGGYWIVKNSWGTGWGESGFIKMGYGQVGVDGAGGGILVRFEVPGGGGTGVIASAAPTSATLSGGQASATLTCTTTGSVTSLEGRCHSSGALSTWAAIATGNSKLCTYTAAGTYVPGCRMNGTLTDDADTAVTVSQNPATVTAVEVTASPASITANKQSTSAITVKTRNYLGTLISGPVTLTASAGGTISPTSLTTTTGGMGAATFTSGTVSALTVATITATSGAVSATTTVTLVPDAPPVPSRKGKM